jgi:hypothetical protein
MRLAWWRKEREVEPAPPPLKPSMSNTWRLEEAPLWVREQYAEYQEQVRAYFEWWDQVYGDNEEENG